MTDDQDMLLDSLSVMPNVKRLIGEQGVTYEKHYCTIAWCCPSRVNFLTGKAAHNTNVTSTGPPYGGWPKFTDQGLNDNYLPVWMNDSDISTYYVGKFMNAYGVHNLAKPDHPKGWTNSSFLLDPWTYNFYHSRWSHGETGEIEKHIGEHTTDVTETKSLAMLDQAAQANNQWFMMVAPVAPHQEIADGVHAPPAPEGYKDLFLDREAPRRDNFNPEEESGASWVRNLPRMTDKQVRTADRTHIKRLQNLAAIDDMTGRIIQRLEDHNMLDDTYVIFTSDNGFHIGNHRLAPGKRCPYEEDINIPLLIRGPQTPRNITSSLTNSHTDMAPTILHMLGLDLRDDFDGSPIPYTSADLGVRTRNEMVNVEFWNAGTFTPIGFKHNSYYNNTYKALRMVTAEHSLFYSSWCTGEREFYDMDADFVQMDNRLHVNATGDGATYYGRSESELVSRLDALLMVMKGCKQDTCREPWNELFPDGSVTSLETAMGERYDSFFENQPKVTFSSCPAGHIIAEEGPQEVLAFT